jgi:hypothetical protein
MKSATRNGPTKEGSRLAPKGAEAIAGLEPQGVIPGKEEGSRVAEEIHIPDYVLCDFGFPERSRSDQQ